MHQVQSNPELKEWYQKKVTYVRGEGPSPGPRPGDSYGGGMRSRGSGGGTRGMDRRFDNGVSIQQRSQQGLPAPAAAAGALPAPAVSAPGQVAVVQEDNSESSSSSGKE